MDYTDVEKRVRILEQQVLALAAALDSARMTAQKAAEDSGNGGPTSTPNSDGFYRFQAHGAINPDTGTNFATLGTGTVRILTVISGIRLNVYPNIDVTIQNDTGGTIADKAFGIGHLADGLFTAFVADCVNIPAGYVADEPH